MNGYESLGYNIYPHLLTNFSIQYLPIYEKTIAEFERRHPEWKDTIYINDDVRDIWCSIHWSKSFMAFKRYRGPIRVLGNIPQL